MIQTLSNISFQSDGGPVCLPASITMTVKRVCNQCSRTNSSLMTKWLSVGKWRALQVLFYLCADCRAAIVITRVHLCARQLTNALIDVNQAWQARGYTLGIIKFWCGSSSGCGSRIHFLLSLALRDTALYDCVWNISHAAVSRFLADFVRWFTPTGGHIQYSLALYLILINHDIWIHFQLWIGITDYLGFV